MTNTRISIFSVPFVFVACTSGAGLPDSERDPAAATEEQTRTEIVDVRSTCGGVTSSNLNIFSYLTTKATTCTIAGMLRLRGATVGSLNHFTSGFAYNTSLQVTGFVGGQVVVQRTEAVNEAFSVGGTATGFATPWPATAEAWLDVPFEFTVQLGEKRSESDGIDTLDVSFEPTLCP